MADEKIHVYVYPNPKGHGAARTGYFIGDPFATLADAHAFVMAGNRRQNGLGRLGACRLVPASALEV